MLIRCAALIFAVLLYTGCNRTIPKPAQNSPDGTKVLTTSVNQSKADPTRYLCVVVDIKDTDGKTLFHEVTPASNTMKWAIQWVDDREVLLKSSDVGNYHIVQQPDGTWKGDLR